MLDSLLHTKLTPPSTRDTIVVRERLTRVLDGWINRKVTVVSAPAGSGKTTLVANWLRSTKQLAAWLSLGEEDNDIARYSSYFWAALCTLDPSLADGVEGQIQSPQTGTLDAISTLLINRISVSQSKFLFVIDDYHRITSKDIHEMMHFWLEHMPSNMHFIFISREVPDLPLPRLRGQNQLLELLETDLRFALSESADFLNQVMGMNLSQEDIQTLEDKTEGWVTGLQLAAISLQGKEDTSSHIASFKGSHHYIFDYLVEEVWEQQPKSIQTFLLRTSVLRQLTPSLCNALLDESSDQESATLEQLVQSNLLIVPLDNERKWYRYHQLFSEALVARLKREHPYLIPELHKRAANWHKQHNHVPDSIYHLLAAEAFTEAATLIQESWPHLRQYFHESTLRSWVETLPSEVVTAHPLLSVYYTIALLPINASKADVHLQEIESKYENSEQNQFSNIAQKDETVLSGLMAFARAYQAATKKDNDTTIAFAQQALSLLPAGKYLYRGSSAVLLAFAQWSNGQLLDAYQSITSSLAEMQKANNLSAVIATQYLAADIQLQLGQMDQAHNTILKALQLVSKSKFTPQGTADLHVLLGEIYYEQNQLKKAAGHLFTAKNLGEHAALQEPRHRWYVVMAKIKAAEGDYDLAFDLLEEAAAWQVSTPTPDVEPIEAYKARFWIRQDDRNKASNWLAKSRFKIKEDPTYLKEFEHLTFIKLFLSQSQSNLARSEFPKDEVAKFLDRLKHTAEIQARTGRLTEILFSESLLFAQNNNLQQGFAPLAKALQLGAQHGYVRLFLDFGDPIFALLKQAKSRNIEPEFVNHLLSFNTVAPVQSKQIKSVSSPLLDPLSDREIEILEQIAKGLTNQQIADRFFLSLYTVKAHARNIYSKLDVHTRTQAVNIGRDLGLIGA